MPIVNIKFSKSKITENQLNIFISRLQKKIADATTLSENEISIHVTEFHPLSRKDEDLYVEIITISERRENFTEEFLKGLAKITEPLDVKSFVWVFFNDAPHS